MSQEQFLRGVGQKKQQVRRKPIAAELRHAIYLRDQGQCAFKDKNGNRCSSQRYLEFHHILPVSKGGKDTLDNLVTLCRGHHQFFHSNLHKDHIS